MATKQQYLSLVIEAIDKAGKVIDRISGKLSGLGDKSQQTSQKTSGLGDAIAVGMMKAQVAIAAVQQGIGFLTNKFREASSIELENLSTASGLDKMMGGFDKAASFVDRLNASLAESAAALPGATADYTALARTITDDVAEAFKGTNGQIKNMAGFEKTLKSISTSYAAMGATSGVDVGNTQLFLMKALGGTGSMAELMQIDALQKNAQLRVKLQEALEKAGVKELKQLTTESRIRLLQQVGEAVITPEFLERSQTTVEGMTQSFISTLFDPMTGIFGLSRDLDKETEGVQSAFTAIRDTMKTLIGTGGLFETVSGLLSDLGLTVDPMRTLRDGVQRLNSYLIQLNEFLKAFRKGGVTIDLQAMFNDMTKGIGNQLSQLSPSFSADIGAKAGIWLGNFIGDILKFLVGLDWGQVLIVIGQVSIQLISGIGAFLIGFGTTLSTRINQALMSVLNSIWNSLLELLDSMRAIAVDTVRSYGGQVKSVGQQAFNMTPAGFLLNKISGKYQGGYIPAFGGLFSSLAAEMAGMPRGASPVIANSSEAIFTPRQLRNLVNGTMAIGAGGGGTFAPQIVINGAGGDTESLAEEVLRRIEIFYRQYQQGQLTAG